ncbi:thioredoxin family protein [Cryobacterium adonitolivorans]|uniref:Thioredoxin family protein n=1 Tax=Cryobacterium adonitolivorans TaxID=1259189 RepID=A0A4R8W0Q5_9MICO|nr:thioredoxin family protein [Cryobacterium adonitolivorans]TFC00150.1 thioredoxin family protein [Cryobacterium adonitolivorans]
MMITVLTQESCPSCVNAKNTLAQLADEYPIDVREIPLASTEGKGLANRVGIVFAPGILIDGELFSYGRLSEKKLRRHLSKLEWPATAMPARKN